MFWVDRNKPAINDGSVRMLPDSGSLEGTVTAVMKKENDNDSIMISRRLLI